MASFSSLNWVDRENEIKIIQDAFFINNYKAVLVYANTGIGKSILSNKFAKFNRNRFDYIIHLRTAPNNNAENLVEGKYIKEIYSLLLKYQNLPKKVNFKKFIKARRALFHKKVISNGLKNSNASDSFKSFLGKNALSISLKCLLHLDQYDPYSYLDIKTANDLIIIASYLEFVFENSKGLIILDNIQNIDSYSKKILLELIANETTQTKYLLEFTTELGSTEKLSSFIKLANDYNASIKIIGLNALLPKYAIKVVSDSYYKQDKNFENLAAEYYINHSNGSMQKLIDYTFQYYNYNDQINKNDPTLGKLQSLSNNELFILSIILLHDGEILLKNLKLIMDSVHNRLLVDYNSILNNLSEKYRLISIENEYAKLLHASTSDTWEQSIIFKKYKLLACSLCKDYYEDIYFNEINFKSKDDIIYMLLKIYSTIDPEQIFTLLNTLQGELNVTILPDKIWKYILIYLSNFTSIAYIDKQILCKLIKFTFNHNLYRQCMYLIDQLRQQKDSSVNLFCKIYEVNCLEYLGFHDKAINLCENELSDKLTDKERYNFYLLLLGCYRSKSLGASYYRNCENSIRQIKNYQSYYPEYGIFLRLSEIYKSHIDAISDLKESIEYFKSKDTLQEVKSRILYAFFLTSQNLHNQAAQEYSVCESLLENRSEFKNILAMNKASMLLRQDIFGDNVEELLNIANLSTTGSYDSLLLLNLRLCNYYYMNNNSLIDSIVYRMENLMKHETDKLLLASTAYNLFLYYKIKNDSKNAKKYFNIANEFRSHNSFVDRSLSCNKFEFMPEKSSDWALGITFFWNVDFDENTQI